MKQNKNNNPKEPSRPASAAMPQEPLWVPTWTWHLKVLGGVYGVITVTYFLVSYFLSRVPEPYRMREIPKEITPWMK